MEYHLVSNSLLKKPYQAKSFNYTCYITPKRVTSLQFPRHSAKNQSQSLFLSLASTQHITTYLFVDWRGKVGWAFDPESKNVCYAQSKKRHFASWKM